MDGWVAGWISWWTGGRVGFRLVDMGEWMGECGCVRMVNG